MKSVRKYSDDALVNAIGDKSLMNEAILYIYQSYYEDLSSLIIHNSGTRQGSAKAFEHYHRYVRKMQNGLAYHFVIGNGTSTGDGTIEIGDRWRRQINGGHVHSDYLNNIALGICLVGDFNRQSFIC